MSDSCRLGRAILLPNARVLVSGSGEGGGVPLENSDFSAQVFTLPYLLNADGTLAARPSISSAPSRISYGGSFSVETPDAGSVARGTLVRLSSVTHALEQSQLIYPLTFAAAGPTTLTGAAPAGATRASPGPCLLFLVNLAGVPSTAAMVSVGPEGGPATGVSDRRCGQGSASPHSFVGAEISAVDQQRVRRRCFGLNALGSWDSPGKSAARAVGRAR